MAAKLKVYLAGPDVFMRDAIEIGRRKKELCDRYGFQGLYPFDNEVPPGLGMDRVIYRANVAMMRDADCGILNLTPFRSASADVGTVFELGFLTGLRKPSFGYTNVTTDLLGRLQDEGGAGLDPDARTWRDAAGMAIENFGNADNLMIDACLAEQGRPLVRVPTSPADRFHDLRGFETCLQLAQAVLADRIRDERRRPA